MRKIHVITGALATAALAMAGALFVVSGQTQAADVSTPTVVTVVPRDVALNAWHDVASFTAPGAVWAESTASLSIHNGLNNDLIQVRATVDGNLFWLGDFRMGQVNWTVAAATRQYELDPGDVMTYQVRVARSGTGNVRIERGHAWWTTQPRTVPTTPPVTASTAPTTAVPTTNPPPTSTPPPGGFPTASTTGVPAGTTLTNDSDCTLENGTYVARRWNCLLNVTGNAVVIRNSELLAGIGSGPSTAAYTIEDSTIGPASGCNTDAALGHYNFTGRRIEIRNMADGVRSEGPNILFEDSYMKLCQTAGSHGDGLQGCDNPPCGGLTTQTNVVFRHNTVDQPCCGGVTANVFWADNSSGGLRVENNLLIGGGFTIRVYHFGGAENVVTGNRVVNNSWNFGYGDNDCDTASNPNLMHWVDNDLVTVDSGYSVTGTVADNVTCT